MECCQFKISHLRSSTLTRSLSAAAMQSITCCQQFERGQEEGISDERKTECTTDLLDTRARAHTHEQVPSYIFLLSCAHEMYRQSSLAL